MKTIGTRFITLAFSAVSGMAVAAGGYGAKDASQPQGQASSGAQPAQSGQSSQPQGVIVGPPIHVIVFEQVDRDKSGNVDQNEAASVQGLRFSEADTNRDGRLSKNEYQAAMQARTENGPQQGQMPSFAQIDRDSNGALDRQEASTVHWLKFSADDLDSNNTISRSEYEAALQRAQMSAGKLGEGQSSTQAANSFDQLDRDRSGVLEREEMDGVPGIDFSTADRDRDGKMSRDEFEAASGTGSRDISEKMPKR